MAGDLGIMVSINKNKEFAIIFGDSFSGNGFGQGNWMSPIGAIATYDDNGQIVVKRPLNKGDRIEQLLKYNHDNNLTLIPSVDFTLLDSSTTLPSLTKATESSQPVGPVLLALAARIGTTRLIDNALTMS